MSTAQTSEQFWEDRYRSMTRQPTGVPTSKLVEHVGALEPGRSLDLGSSRGDDVLWLARQGWHALGVDISMTAVQMATERAQELGLAAMARFERHDLAQTFPKGEFDLVTALYFQSPIEFPRAEVLRTAAAAVVKGGHFFLVEHATAAPWSYKGTTPFSTVDETFASLQLDATWETLWIGAPERQAKGPHDQVANVLDNVIFLRRA
jgi:SAM-dependent methyltransferase